MDRLKKLKPQRSQETSLTERTGMKAANEHKNSKNIHDPTLADCAIDHNGHNLCKNMRKFLSRSNGRPLWLSLARSTVTSI